MTDSIYEDPNPPAWPHNGIPSNRWYTNLPEFIRRLAGFQWYKDGHRFKYVRITVDTRNGNFVIFDRDNKAACPDDIFPPNRAKIMTELKREQIVGVMHKGRSIHVERIERPANGVNNRMEVVYDGFSNGVLTQKEKPADAIIRWLGNALEDGT